VIDAPLLVEANLTGMADYVVVVTASRRTQIERCRRKFHISGKEVLGRIRNQVPMKRKVELSDFVIDNDGSRKETIRQANKIWKEIIWK
jgi:dephospho-CoA kinase